MFVLWGARQEKTPDLFSDTIGLAEETLETDYEEEASAERIAEAFKRQCLDTGENSEKTRNWRWLVLTRLQQAD